MIIKEGDIFKLKHSSVYKDYTVTITKIKNRKVYYTVKYYIISDNRFIDNNKKEFSTSIIFFLDAYLNQPQRWEYVPYSEEPQWE
jgi:hypothetical protein